MNVLWEKFAVASLRKSFRANGLSYILESQSSKDFWIPTNSRAKTIRPDIVIRYNKNEIYKNIILDTKWKNVDKSASISLDILRQMYVYHEYFNAEKVAIVYPGEMTGVEGHFDKNGVSQAIEKKCALLPVPVGDSIGDLHSKLFSVINTWITKA
jgi:5-methylcytosine-specific restriction enzyme subunit McrC